MARKAFGLLLGLALSVSWAGPLCAMAAGPSHACCAGGDAPMPSPEDKNLPACCRPAEAVPAPAAIVLQAPAPALLPSVVTVVETPAPGRLAPPRPVPTAPQAPPGRHSGLSPPSSGL